MSSIRGKTFYGYVAKAYPPGYDPSNIEVNLPSLFPTLGSGVATAPRGLNPSIIKNSFPGSSVVTQRISLPMPISESSYKPPSIAKGTCINVVFMTEQIGSGHIIFITK